jgi:hypothetical protein
METEIMVRPFYKKTPFIVITCLLAAFMIYHTVMSVMAPSRKLDEIRTEYGFVQQAKNPVDERIFSDSAYLSLMKEKAYYQSRVAMAATDSIYMTINLADSSLNLEISGVVVHTTDIKDQKISSILKRDEYSVLNMLSAPLVIDRDYSTIKKEPLMIKMAPKDTSEYEPDIIPDTADFEPVNFILVMENGISIYVYQEEKLKFGDGFRRFVFDLRDRLHSAAASMAASVTFRVPEYRPYIRLKLARADAKRIYRALPYHGQVGLYR